MSLALYNQTNIDQLEWPESEEALQAHALLLPMIKEGVEKYVENVKTTLYILKVDEHILPITVNDKEYHNSYLTSNYYPIKYLEESLPVKYPRLYWAQKPFVKLAGMALKGVKINKVVIVNNWLLTTNIYPNLTEKQVEAVTAYLKKRFPDYLLIFRSLDARKCSSLTSNLKKQRYRLVGSRHVFVYDPAYKDSLSKKARYHHRRDRRLIESEGYEVVKVKHDEAGRALNLYHHIYLTRHTMYGPRYTKKFVEEALESRFLDLIGVKREGKIHGVIGCCERNETLIVPFFGFDPNYGAPNHVYRILTMVAITEAEKRGIVLNDGSGGAAPKKHRGMKEFPEYVAFYDRHLPLYRRLFWALTEKVMASVFKPLSEG